VQEGLVKIDACADLSLRWHLIGHLQSNKARKAALAFTHIHSIDSLAVLEAVDRAAAEAGTSPHLLVQVDLAGEATKHGAPVSELWSLLAAAARCRAARLTGLMLLPPFPEDPEEVRPYFRQLRELRDRAVSEGVVDAAMVAELSMGMSHDFEIAAEEGATMVRVGTAIFGSRL
jgi:pyridoxal phosphate enzyme (YggS family)